MAGADAKQGNPDLIGTGALERASIEQWLQTEAQSFDSPSAEMVYSLAILPPTLPRQQNDNNGNGIGSGFNARDVAVGSNADASSGKRGVAGSQQPAANQSQVSPQKEEEMLKLFEQRKDLEKLLDIYEQRPEEKKKSMCVCVCVFANVCCKKNAQRRGQRQRRNPPPATPPATSARRVPACDLRRRAPWPHRPAVAPPLLGPATARRRPRPSRLRGSAAQPRGTITAAWPRSSAVGWT
ncbi:uncharacterized protein [Miscanthus floridulus]|uniref:uncharacterized protein n=1 Tax=Miscanthus floridulus TaxID=154761 RepID=UPI00345AA2FC